MLESRKSEIKTIVKKLAEDLIANYATFENTGGIYSGKMGIAMFLANYHLYTQEEKYEAVIYQCISDSLEGIDPRRGTSLSGIAGVGWALNYLISQQFLDKEEIITYLKKLEDVVVQTLVSDISQENYDLMHGLIGKILFLKLQYQQGITSQNVLQEHILQSIDFLEKTAIRDQSGLAWKYESVYRENQGIEFSLGLSHGVPAIIAYLSELKDLAFLPTASQEKITRLLQMSVTWLLDKKNTEVSKWGMYPHFYTPDKTAVHRSRLAWCYGDLGVAIALLKASKSLKNTEYYHEAKAVALHAARRTIAQSSIFQQDKDASVLDIGICHGLAGVAHIFYQLAQEISEPLLLQSAIYWNELILDSANQDIYCGFKACKISKDAPTEWNANGNLLEGAAGVGLVLLNNYLRERSPKVRWDEFFFTKL